MKFLPFATLVSTGSHILTMWSRIGAFGWEERLKTWTIAILRTPEPEAGDVTAIILSYKRPMNIAPIVSALLRASSIKSIIISNHNTDVSSASLFPKNPRVQIVEKNGGDAYQRYSIAATQPGTYFLSIDDDVFMTPTQIDKLCAELKKNPTTPHGIFGQFRRKKHGFISGIVRYEGPIDVINRVYAFTKKHAESVVRLHDKYWQHEKLCMWDDIIVSATGEGKPLCHDVGHVMVCPSSREKGVALCRLHGFQGQRERAFWQLARF